MEIGSTMAFLLMAITRLNSLKQNKLAYIIDIAWIVFHRHTI